MAITDGYITLNELKDHMGKPQADTSNDTLYENAIESASRDIDYSITGRRDYVVFKEHTLDESKVIAELGLNADCAIMNYAGSRIIFPNKISSISAVTNGGTSLTVNEDYVVGYDFIESLSQFTQDKTTGVLISGVISSDTVPDQIKKLCKNIAEVYTGMSTRVVTDSDGNDVEIRLKNLPSWVVSRLKSIRMPIY